MPEGGKKLFTPIDIRELKWVDDPQISPDGTRVAYTLTTVDPDSSSYHSAIMVAPTGADPSARGRSEADRPDALPFTNGLHDDRCPRWSPDGRFLAFLSGRDAGFGSPEALKRGSAQIWVAPATGGEARPVTAIADPIFDLVWAPDSRRIGLTAFVRPNGPEWLTTAPAPATAPATAPAPPADRADELSALLAGHAAEVKRVTRAFYQAEGLGFLGDRRTHAFVVDAFEALSGGPGRAPAAPLLRVTHGDLDHFRPAFSPDGTRLAVSVNDHGLVLPRWSNVWVYDIPTGDSRGQPLAPRFITTGNGAFFNPSWSPDGRRIAFLGHRRPVGLLSDFRLWVAEVDAQGNPRGDPRCLTDSFDRSFGTWFLLGPPPDGEGPPVWSADGTTLFALATDRGTVHLHAVDAATGRVSRLTTGDRVVYGWSASGNRKSFGFAVAGPEDLGDIHVGTLPSDAASPSWPPAPAESDCPEVVSLRRVTRANTPLVEGRELVRAERFTFAAPGGPTADGWVVRPARLEEGRRYPAVLSIAGGPGAMYGSTFVPDFQILAASGLAVIYTNPRGCHGYGEEFCGALYGDWATSAFADVMAGVDEALRRYPWIDPDRLGVMGASYGGYLTAWTIGQTHRFRAACPISAPTNFMSLFGTGATEYMREGDWGGTPWGAAEHLVQQSPMGHVVGIASATLILHGEEDRGVPIEQAEQLYSALRKLGVTTEFVRYPGAGHNLAGRPWRWIHYLAAVREWFERYL